MRKQHRRARGQEEDRLPGTQQQDVEEASRLRVTVEDWADSGMDAIREKEARVSGRSQGRNECAERGHHFPRRRIPGDSELRPAWVWG